MKWLVLLPGALFSLYMNNPAAPEMAEIGIVSKEASWAVMAGAATDFVFHRPMKIENRQSEENVKLSHLDISNYFGTVTLNLFDRVELYSGFGTAKFAFRWRPIDGTFLDYTTKSDFGWTVGGRAILFFVDALTCGCSASYLTTKPDFSSITQNDTPLDTSGSHLAYSEWQVGLGVTYHYKFLFPYLGVAFSSPALRITNPSDVEQLNYPQRSEDFKSSDVATLVVGLGLSHETLWETNLEVRLIGETACSLSATLRW